MEKPPQNVHGLLLTGHGCSVGSKINSTMRKGEFLNSPFPEKQVLYQLNTSRAL